MKTTSDPRKRGMAEGYRSGLEERVAADLAKAGIEAEYEAHQIYFLPPVKQRRYTPDFILPNGIIIETKGRFVTADRTKHRFIREEHPDLDIRFVFSNPNAKIGKASATSYGAWCVRYGFLFAKLTIPQSWIDEPVCQPRVRALLKAGTK